MKLYSLAAFLCIFFGVSWPSLALAKEVSPPPISAGQVIDIKDWDIKSATFEVIDTKYEAQGPNFVTVEDLAASVTTLDLKKLKKDPSKIVGNQYKLDKELPLQPLLKTIKLREATKQ